jgi:alkanesulfonate monooxygenase SsuD/methylene tetrahydromethanopterin reductase-like flavin-dependent oxidoreductase (luciferase family)
MRVGIVLPTGAAEAQAGPPPSYQDVRALAMHAEQAGFDSLWAIDHLLYRFHDPRRGGALRTVGVGECWTLLAALAEATSRVQIGTLVSCVPFRHPAVLAKMAVTLDEVSGGRVMLGLGAGWHEPELDAFGAPSDYLGSRFEEALQIICPLVPDTADSVAKLAQALTLLRG